MSEHGPKRNGVSNQSSEKGKRIIQICTFHLLYLCVYELEERERERERISLPDEKEQSGLELKKEVNLGI